MTEKDVAELLKKEIGFRLTKSTEISLDQDIIRDLGLDSLDYAAVVVVVENSLGGELDESAIDWSKVKTINDLAKALFENVKSD